MAREVGEPSSLRVDHVLVRVAADPALVVPAEETERAAARAVVEVELVVVVVAAHAAAAT